MIWIVSLLNLEIFKIQAICNSFLSRMSEEKLFKSFIFWMTTYHFVAYSLAENVWFLMFSRSSQ